MDKRTTKEIRRFIHFINAKRLTHIIDSIAEGLDCTEQEACWQFDYDVFDYINACEVIAKEEEKYGDLYQEMIAEQHRQDEKE